jgi:predicted house-cleaning noncanonical NTP pyrophosphatase (MazG superfamily)
MKIVFNTHLPQTAASIFYQEALSKLENLTINCFDDYSQYDVALFMSFKKDLNEIKKARAANPQIKIGIVDPRSSQVELFIEQIDFFIVDSIETKDFFTKYQKPLFSYYEYPEIKEINKIHVPKKKITIGYHGNKVHLYSMSPHITKALDLLAENYEIEFWAIYNISHLGIWNVGLPKKIQVKHIQWSPEVYEEFLSKVDIGIVPNLMPIKNLKRMKSKSQIAKTAFLDSEDDYLLRFKVSSNAGRIFIFAKLGIPIVADMFPSALQFIRDEKSGLLAYSSAAWYTALERLILDHQYRNTLANTLIEEMRELIDFDKQNQKLISFIDSIEVLSNICKQVSFTDDEIDLKTIISFKKEGLVSQMKSAINGRFNRT